MICIQAERVIIALASVEVAVSRRPSMEMVTFPLFLVIVGVIVDCFCRRLSVMVTYMSVAHAVRVNRFADSMSCIPLQWDWACETSLDATKLTEKTIRSKNPCFFLSNNIVVDKKANP